MYLLTKLKRNVAQIRYELAALQFSEKLRCLSLAEKGGFNEDQPRDDLGRWTNGGATNDAAPNDPEVQEILEWAERLRDADIKADYKICLDRCYKLLERYMRPRWSDLKDGDFQKCLNACLGR